MPQPTSVHDRSADELAADCLRHFDQEERLLQQKLQLVDALRASLRTRDAQSLTELTARTATHVESESAVVAARQMLRGRISEHCSVPIEQAGVRLLASRCSPEWARSLTDRAHRLHQLTMDVSRRNQANILVAAQLARCVEQVVERLTGKANLGCYGATGRMAGDPMGNIFREEC